MRYSILGTVAVEKGYFRASARLDIDGKTQVKIEAIQPRRSRDRAERDKAFLQDVLVEQASGLIYESRRALRTETAIRLRQVRRQRLGAAL